MMISMSLITTFLTLLVPGAAAPLPECLQTRSLISVGTQLELSRSGCLLDWMEERSRSDKKQLPTSIGEEVRNRSSLYAPTNVPVRFDLGPGQGELFSRNGSLILAVPGELEVSLIAATEYRVSPDGKKILFINNPTGYDAPEWRFYDLSQRKVLPDSPIRIRWSYIGWDSTGEGVYYTKWATQAEEEIWRDLNVRRSVPLAYHRLGTLASEDEILFDTPEKKTSMIFSAVKPVFGDGLLVFRQFGSGVPTPMYWKQGSGTTSTWTQIQGSDDDLKTGSFMGRVGNEAIFKSAECGSSYCLIAIRLAPPFARRNFIPYTPHLVLNSAQLIGSYLLTTFIDTDLKMRIRTYDLHGRLVNEITPEQMGLPIRGSLSGFSGNRQSLKTYFTYSSMNLPPVTLTYDLQTLKIARLKPTKVHPFEGAPIRVEMGQYPSFDGTSVPIHVYSRTDLKTPPKFAMLFYYGALGATYLPSYNSKFMAILEMGGMVAVANVRGGGERGYDWYKAGSENKTVTVKDIAWASRWLKSNYKIEQNRIVAEGSSWGGLHTYLALIDFADDFSAFISGLPVASLPYSFQSSLFGWIIPDDVFFKRSYQGEHIDFEKQIQNSIQWSALENVSRMKMLKPILTLVSKNDERVGREPAGLMTAALLQKFSNSAPVYLVEAASGGHSMGGVLSEELGFIGKVFDISELKPLPIAR